MTVVVSASSFLTSRVTLGLVALGKLRPHPSNPRTMPEAELEKLIRSLEEFGLVDPVVARKEDALLVGGHYRVLAAKTWLARRGCSPALVEAAEVPVAWVSGLSDDRALLLNLALNKISGEWDYGKLGEVLASLEKLPPPVLELSGFTMPQIEDVRALTASLPPVSAGGKRGDMGGDDVDPMTAGELTAAADARARRLVVEFDTDAEVAEAKAVLARFGHTGPADLAGAMLAALRAAGTKASKGKRVPGVLACPKCGGRHYTSTPGGGAVCENCGRAMDFDVDDAT